MKRSTKSHDRSGTAISPDDLGAALATCLIAASAAICRQFPDRVSGNALISDIQQELEYLGPSLHDGAGKLLPAADAIRGTAAMLNGSNPAHDQPPCATRKPVDGSDHSGRTAAEAASAVARRLWPKNTARHLGARSGTSHRAAKYWLDQHTGMSADALAALLRSDAGLEILREIFGAEQPAWFFDLLTAGSARDAVNERLDAIRAEIAEERKKLLGE